MSNRPYQRECLDAISAAMLLKTQHIKCYNGLMEATREWFIYCLKDPRNKAVYVMSDETKRKIGAANKQRWIDKQASNASS